MRLPWLADAARATGYPVKEVDGWQTRGSTLFIPKGLVWHHTAGPVSGDMPSLNILINGRTGLPGPLSQYGLGRSGTIYVVASGRANHAGEGDWNGLTGNGSVVGIEAEHTGKTTEPWPPIQLDAYRKLSAQILTRLGATTIHMCAHREWARNRTTSRKIDPISLNMDEERSRVAALMTQGDDDMIPMWTKDLDETGWRNLARDGIAVGGEAAVVQYWVVEGAARTDDEHQAASTNMYPQLLARAARVGSGGTVDLSGYAKAGHGHKTTVTLT